jgi:hypothetical protein
LNENVFRGEVDFFQGFSTKNPVDFDNKRLELPMHGFFSNLLDTLFEIFSLPYICKLNYKLGNGFGDVVIFKKRNMDDELDDRDVFLIVEMKRNVREKEGENQLITYSRYLLENYKGRFMVLLMVCDIMAFTFYCAIRINGEVVLIQLGEHNDHFSFGSDARGLLKLLYVLNLPWPIYGSMIITDENNSFQILKQEKLLGSGSSAEVYQYKLDNKPSVAMKFFKSSCKEQFAKEVYIYSLLKGKDISLEMLWSNEERLTICIDGVRNPISLPELSSNSIEDLFKSLRTFHKFTNHVHRDLYHMNILGGSANGKLYLNDFGLAAPISIPQVIKGNLYFASDNVLSNDKSDGFYYHFSDDLFSLTFSLIFLQFPDFFIRGFNQLRLIENVDRKSILSKRHEIIKKMAQKNIILMALQAATEENYDMAKNCILKLLFGIEPIN